MAQEHPEYDKNVFCDGGTSSAAAMALRVDASAFSKLTAFWRSAVLNSAWDTAAG